MHAVVLCAAGDKGFCAGLDMRGGELRGSMADWDAEDVAVYIGPKHNQVWKPVVTAVHGSCCAGAMYFLNESDIVIASEEAMFFDSHVSYGAASVFEAIGMRMFVPPREALRWMLLDLEERMSAATSAADRPHQRGCVPRRSCCRMRTNSQPSSRRSRRMAFREASKRSGMACGRSSPTLIGGGSGTPRWRSPAVHLLMVH